MPDPEPEPRRIRRRALRGAWLHYVWAHGWVREMFGIGRVRAIKPAAIRAFHHYRWLRNLPEDRLDDYQGIVIAWLAQGRTDPWIAHQLEVTVAELDAYRKARDLPPANPPRNPETGATHA